MSLSTVELAALSELLEQALELPLDRRIPWLDALPQEHAGLKATLRNLLARADSPETADLLHTLPKLDRPDATHLNDRSAGDRVGPYKLIRALGQGGMGTVWLAERADGALKRQLALKLPLMAALPLMRRRLAIERDILAALEHPHIARLYDAGVDSSGQPYLALEYVEGELIDAYCHSHAVNLRERLSLFLQVARAVAYAHANLVLHRDLKPSNILVTADAQVRLLDFGIAKLLHDDLSDDTALTQLAGRALTPDYASPEQILGQPMTVVSDVYSLGVVLFELLTGQRPYHLTQGSSAALADSIRAVRIAPPSSVVNDAKLRRQLAGDLDTIVLKALKPELAERYPSASALIDDIERLQAGQPIRARPDSRAYRLRKFVARNRLAVASAVAVFLALLVGAGGALWQTRVAGIERDRALVLLERSQTALDFMELMVTEAIPVDEKVSRGELLERSERIAKRALSGNPEQLALVLSTLSSHYNSHSERTKALVLTERAAELVRRSPDAALRAEIECQRGLTLAMSGEGTAGMQAIEGWLARPDLEPSSAAQCERYLVQIAFTNGDAKAALTHALAAKQRLAQATRPLPMLEASVLADLAYAESINGRGDLADRDYAAALKVYKDRGREQGFSYLAILNNWAVAAIDSGDIQRALVLIEEALHLSDGGADGAKPPTYVVSNHAFVLVTLGRYPQALAEAKRAFELARDAGSAQFQVRALLTQAQVHRELGDLKQAHALIDAAAVEAAKHAPESYAAISVQLHRARLALADRQMDDALVILEPVLQRLEKDDDRTAAMVNALRIRAEARWQRGDVAAAIADAQRSVAIARDAQSGKSHSYITGLASLLLGRIEQDAGHVAAARAALKSAVEHLSATLGDDHPETRNARLALGE